MGKSLAVKNEIIADLKQTLSESQLVIAIDYKGLTVAEITDLRRRLRPKGSSCQVAKNTLMRIAVEGNETWQPMQELLTGTSAFLFVQEDIGGAIKAYQEFQKVSKKTELRGGVMEGRVLKEADVKALADLPSKEQLMAQIAGAINGVATKLAVGINQVPTSIARGLKAYAEKDGDSAEVEAQPEAEAEAEAQPEAEAESVSA
ncbi:MAG: 50S ribosomal protein L10 [Oscillatoriales cyanobacterium]|uniref:Large ribosomal subunit protein uL10 n=1 Tax=Microcoleus anatoxicus PTRS2 TaxID=2705321 RepID=A0ABU8YPD0_9CYAN|nr:MAG: 50S ribosomal protein L10 [Oscillatoriales cyanobacterium]TAD94120.1 MAG: 50S ribosomal protein L10 [Oscillatoriales cyanobacterium]TAE06334.1 MAG: 50S ribosomal protein L10 [Oscillatoriales cyanobacterium]TAF02114.1 MAG: 50S ribosomal protein L10 [Oscillatoriales cyanobacterium]TAF37111.1 MAG: 50S ribosomal protein L10 [Oscillatoriales cyanobacterium]